MRVKVIKRDGNAALVEWVDGEHNSHRVILPSRLVGKNGECDERELARGVPHGMPWASVVEMRATPEELERNLHNLGIWTVDDLRAKPEVAQAAIMATYGIDFAALCRAARES